MGNALWHGCGNQSRQLAMNVQPCTFVRRSRGKSPFYCSILLFKDGVAGPAFWQAVAHSLPPSVLPKQPLLCCKRSL